MPTAVRGRPRSFDRDQAVHQAMLAFWDDGYERTSVASLVELMGIRPPSFYAAFGSKEALFLETLELYRSTVGSKTLAALESAAGRAAISAFLKQCVINATTRDSSGCLITLSSQASVHASDASTAVASLQAATWAAVYRRLQLSLLEGALSATADLPALADFLITFVNGISLQAQRGTKAPALQSAANLAVNALPWIELGSQRPAMADTVD